MSFNIAQRFTELPRHATQNQHSNIRSGPFRNAGQNKIARVNHSQLLCNALEEEYRALCDRVIDNNGDESDIKRQLKEILDHEIC